MEKNLDQMELVLFKHTNHLVLESDLRLILSLLVS